MIYIFGQYGDAETGQIVRKHGKQSFDPEKEQRLVNEGVAKFIQEDVEKPAEKAKETVESLEKKTVTELREIAEGRGIDVKGIRKKSDILKALQAF